MVAHPARRSALVALYSFDNELAAVAARAANPTMGEIRLAWWAEEARASLGGGPISNSPVAQALAGSAPLLSADALERLVEARYVELEPQPFADEAALVDYIDAAFGGAMAAAALVLTPDAPVSALVHAARAWGWARLLSAGWAWRPASWGAIDARKVADHVRHRVRDALVLARAGMETLPAPAFPAAAHATLAKPYAEGRRLIELEKHARLLIATVKGRI